MKQNTGLQVRVRRSKLSDVPVQVNVGRDRDNRDTKVQEDLKAGDKVKVDSFGIEGIITKIQHGSPFALVLANGVNQYFNIDDIRKLNNIRTNSVRRVGHDVYGR